MKLSKRVDQYSKPVYEKEKEKEKEKEETVWKKAPPLDWSKHVVNWDREIPYGKYKGSTLEDVKYSDEWYWKWIVENDIINQWGLYDRKAQPIVKGVKAFYSETDKCQWITLEYFDGAGCEPCPEFWYK